MRKNGAVSAYIENEEEINMESQKTPGSCNKRKIVPGSNVSNDKRSCSKLYPELRNCVWSYHLISMPANYGQLIWIFSVIDEHTKECLLCQATHHIGAQNVIDQLFGLFLQRGIPRYLFTFDDNGAIAEAICEWLEKLEVDSPFVELKRYGENGYGIAFREKLMKDFSNEKRLASLADVRLWLANCRNEHNRSMNLLRV